MDDTATDSSASHDTARPVRLTGEPEVTGPVDLCTPDGQLLSERARGWSRRPLHHANLRGRWGRTKRWDYWAVLAPDHVVSITYADVDYLGLVDVWWADLAAGRTGGRGTAVPGARGIDLPDHPGTRPLRYSSRRLRVEIVDGAEGTRLRASWREPDGRPGELDALVELPLGHESLNVVIPWTDRTFQYTSKHQARPTTGHLVVGDDVVELGGSEPAWGVLDVGRGRWPYRTRWNWASGAGRATTGEVVGLQLGGKWTEGTGFTENGLIIDGRLHKLGDELVWDYDWTHPLRPWRATDPGGRLDLRLVPRFDRHSRTEALVAGTEVHQVFGTWWGTVVTDDGAELELRAAVGFAEESRSRW
jgi:hypothetical protein